MIDGNARRKPGIFRFGASLNRRAVAAVQLGDKLVRFGDCHRGLDGRATALVLASPNALIQRRVLTCLDR
jgi:hypothetical protein